MQNPTGLKAILMVKPEEVSGSVGTSQRWQGQYSLETAMMWLLRYDPLHTLTIFCFKPIGFHIIPAFSDFP